MSGFTGTVCPICSEGMETFVKELRCGHQFHIGCIDDWLEGTSHCPCCMGFIESDPSEPNSEADPPNPVGSNDSHAVLAVDPPNAQEQNESPNAQEQNDSPIDLTADPPTDEDELCPICSEVLGSYVKELWCYHQFHIGCIDSWMECTSHCPSCMGYV